MNDCSINRHNTLERFNKLISDIKKGEKLSYEHINTASQLVHGQFEDVQGPRMFTSIWSETVVSKV